MTDSSAPVTERRYVLPLILVTSLFFLWALGAPNRLNRQARILLSSEREGLFLSAASSWEITVKFALGKLTLPEPPAKYIPMWMQNWGIHSLDISHRHALAIADLPSHHQDPFDRMLICQAIARGMTILTSDDEITQYPVLTSW